MNIFARCALLLLAITLLGCRLTHNPDRYGTWSDGRNVDSMKVVTLTADITTDQVSAPWSYEARLSVGCADDGLEVSIHTNNSLGYKNETTHTITMQFDKKPLRHPWTYYKFTEEVVQGFYRTSMYIERPEIIIPHLLSGKSLVVDFPIENDEIVTAKWDNIGDFPEKYKDLQYRCKEAGMGGHVWPNR